MNKDDVHRCKKCGRMIISVSSFCSEKCCREHRMGYNRKRDKL